jgi:hypothetical protein
MSECKSCVGCKFLYGNGSGYSNYTWMETYVTCAKGKNPELNQAEEPYNWDKSAPENDNWNPTQNGRCELYAEGPYLTLDPDRECWPADNKWRQWFDRLEFVDEEQYIAIMESDSDYMEYRARLPFDEYMGRAAKEEAV